MSDDERLVIEYRGDPRCITAFVQALGDEGLEWEYTLPGGQVIEKRGGGWDTFEAAGHVYVVIETWAADHPIVSTLATNGAVAVSVKAKAAVDRWRAGRLARAAQVEVKSPRHRA